MEEELAFLGIVAEFLNFRYHVAKAIADKMTLNANGLNGKSTQFLPRTSKTRLPSTKHKQVLTSYRYIYRDDSTHGIVRRRRFPDG